MDNALAVRAKLLKWAELDPPEDILDDDGKVMAGVKGAIVGTMNRKCGGDANRRLILSWLFSPFEGLEPISSKELTDKQVGALVRWIDWYKDPDINEWLTGADFDKEILVVLTATMLVYNKSPLVVKDEHPAIDPFSPLLLGVDLGGEIVAIDDGETIEEELPNYETHVRHRHRSPDYSDVLEDF